MMQERPQRDGEDKERLRMRIHLRWNSAGYTASGLAVLVCLVTGLTINDSGITWDEGLYLSCGDIYMEWMVHPRLSEIQQYWQYNSEHPPLVKIVGGLSKYLLSRVAEFNDPLVPFRLGNLLYVFVMTFCFASLALRLWPFAVAIVVTMIYSLNPHIFFLSHLGTMDYAVATWWFTSVYLLFDGYRDLRWVFLSGLAVGLGILTKFNGFLLPPLLLTNYLIHSRASVKQAVLDSLKGRFFAVRVHINNAFRFLAPILLFGAVMQVLFWPWLWDHLTDRFIDYINFHRYHVGVPVHYFGQTYSNPPWHLPFTMISFALPTGVVCLIFLGLWKSRKDPFLPLIVWNAFVPMLFVAIGPSKHDAVRLLLPAFPFLYLVAGFGLTSLWQTLEHYNLKYLVRCILIGSVGTLIVLFSTGRYHPYEFVYFNSFLGGPKGAMARGIEYHDWSSSFRDLVPWLNQHLGTSYAIALCPEPLLHYRNIGLLSPDFIHAEPTDADYLILPTRFGFFTEEYWQMFRFQTPVFSVSKRGVQLIAVYRLR
jgi:4-amino-4-deoxy-L-arabinose transferase-like glycosyltransferase